MFAQRLKDLRELHNITQIELAKKLNVSSSAVAMWESSRTRKPSTNTLFAIANYFKVTTDYLLGHSSMQENQTDSDGRYLSSNDEFDLVNTYRKLTTNSKQIVLTVAQLEYRHVSAVAQGEVLIKILPKTKKELDELIKRSLAKKSSEEKAKYIKVYNQSAAAGYGNYLSDDDQFEMVKVPVIPFGAEFGIRISGRSMEPRINDGDIVFVKRQSRIEIGEIGVFIYDNEAYCKQLIYKDNKYYLHSFNVDSKKYPDIQVMSESVYTVGLVLDNFHEDN